MDTTHHTQPLPPPWNLLAPFAAKIFVWGALVGLLVVLRSFFALIFLTFVFAYIQQSAVQKLQVYLHKRTLCVVIIGLIFLGIIVGLGSYLVPQIKDQTKHFLDRWPQTVASVDREIIYLANTYPLLQSIVTKQPEHKGAEVISDSPTTNLLQQIVGLNDGDDKSLKNTFETVKNIGTYLVAMISAFFLALLFSFLIVLDLPRLSASARRLRSTRLQFIYDEVAGTFVTFARVVGRAFEAQTVIAALNTVLTGICLRLMGLQDSLAFLSMIVFFGSFIPIAGVFISSVPICLLALEAGGVNLVLIAIGAITVVHMIEAYILNPRIYGAHLRMNPVVVLIILTVSGKLAGIWGLLLGVPLCTYIMGHAIQRRGRDI